MEHQRTQDAADRVDQRALPHEDPLQSLRRPDKSQQRAHHGRSRDDQDDPEHHPRDMPSSGAAAAAPSAQVISTPSTISLITTRRVCPLTFRRSRPRPASYRMTATDNDTRGSNAGPSSRSGLTSVVSAPAAKPTG